MQTIIKQISQELNLDEELVEKVVRSEFRFVRDVMEAGEMDSVMLHYFGKFAVKPNRFNYLPDDFKNNIHKSGKEIVNNKPVD